MANYKIVKCAVHRDLEVRGEVEAFDTELRAFIGAEAGWSYDCGLKELAIEGAPSGLAAALALYGEAEEVSQ